MKEDVEQPWRRHERLSFWFSHLSRTLSQHMLCHVREEFGINLAEYRVMILLAECGPLSTRTIGEEAVLDKAQVVRAVASLAKRHFVINDVDSEDLRLRRVRLTPAGKTICRAVLPFIQKRQSRLLAHLSRDERDMLPRVIRQMLANAREMLNEIHHRRRKTK